MFQMRIFFNILSRYGIICKIKMHIMHIKSKNKCYFVTLVITSALLSFIFFAFLQKNNGKQTFILCDVQDENITIAVGDRWEAVDEEESAYVFSAYLIPEDFHTDWFTKLKSTISNLFSSAHKTSLMFVGALQINSHSVTFFCHMWYHMDNGFLTSVVTAATILWIETHTLRYDARLFACNLPDDRVPDLVAITTSQCSIPLRTLKPHLLGKGEPKLNFTVCLSPMFDMTKQEHARQFIEWVELNRILGAGHFIVYNHSVGKELNYVLQMYEETGLVEVVQWDVPFLEHEIQYYGQNAALNDCLLRSRLKSRYLVNEDMDEFIIPQEKHVYTWNQLLELYPKHSSYSFISSFYPVEYHSHINQTNENVFTQLVTLTSAQRGTKFHEDKTKYIARTDTVLIIVVHYAMVFKWGGQTNIPPAIGFLHHYIREVEYTTVRDKYGGEFVEDTTVRDKYGGEFVEDTTVRDKYGGEFVEDTTVRDKYGRELTNNTKEPLKSLKKFVSSLN